MASDSLRRPPWSPFSSRRGGRRCRRIAAVRGRCRRGVVNPLSDKPHSTLDKVNQKRFGPEVHTRHPRTPRPRRYLTRTRALPVPVAPATRVAPFPVRFRPRSARRPLHYPTARTRACPHPHRGAFIRPGECRRSAGVFWHYSIVGFRSCLLFSCSQFSFGL